MTAFKIALVHTKGGVGKSLLAAQIEGWFSRQKDGLGRWRHRVGVIDTNGKQGTATRRLGRKRRYDVPQPQLRTLGYHHKDSVEASHDADAAEMERAIGLMEGQLARDVIIIDSPGVDDGHRSEYPLLAAEWADVIVTPVLADGESTEQIGVKLRTSQNEASDLVEGPCLMTIRAARNENKVPWFVVPNRLPATLSPWRQRKLKLLETELGPAFDFTVTAPIMEREAYGAAIDKGLSPLDMATRDLRRSIGRFDAAERAEIVAETESLIRSIAPHLAAPASQRGCERRLDLADQLKAS